MSPLSPALPLAARQLVLGADEPGALPARRAVRLAAWAALAVLFGADVVQLGRGGQEDELVALLLALAQAGAVAVALRRPLAGWRLSLPATAITPVLVTDPPGATVVLHLAALFLLAVAAPWRVTALAAAVIGLAGAAWTFAAYGPSGAGAALAVVALVAALGTAIRAQRGTSARLAAARSGVAREEARRAVLEERTRIARDMHDVVAHHLSALAVRAESAPHRLPGTPPEAAAEFGTLAGAAREALTDMRRLLGVLRADDPERPSAPAPDLDGIAELVATLRGSGMDVELTVTGEPRPVPGEIGLAGYRVVQEALSNAARHATGAPVRVTVAWQAAGVRLRVANGPGTASGGPPGTGLVGMRERVAAVGGELRVGPRAGGYLVDATLPVP